MNLVPNPVIVIVINKRLCSRSQDFTQTYSDFLAESVSVSAEHQRCLGRMFNQPACWDLRKGFVPSGPPAAALVSLFLLPTSLDGRQSDMGRFPPSSPGPLFKSLLLLVFISLPAWEAGAKGELYDLGREACMHGPLVSLQHPPPCFHQC